MMSGRAAESTESDQKDTLYERDSYAWALGQALALRERRVSALDWDNLAEEVADLAARYEDSLKSYCRILVEHLLKLARASKPARSNNLRLWTNCIKNARLQIADLLEAHPGIKSKAPELFAKA